MAFAVADGRNFAQKLLDPPTRFLVILCRLSKRQGTELVTKTFANYPLPSEFVPAYEVSWSSPITNSPDVLNWQVCNSQCGADDRCAWNYYQDNTNGMGFASCWLVGFGDAYPNDDAAAAPRKKRAIQTQMGMEGGMLGIIADDVGCNEDL